MRILALDPATHCGFAYGELEDLATGTWDLSVRKDESAGMRLIRLRSKLNQLREIGVGLLVYEAARTSRFPATLKVQSKLEAVIQVWATDAGIEYRGYSPTEIKRFATGKGTAKKSEMINAAIHKFGREVADDNEADALALWHLAWSEYSDSNTARLSPSSANPIDDTCGPANVDSGYGSARSSTSFPPAAAGITSHKPKRKEKLP